MNPAIPPAAAHLLHFISRTETGKTDATTYQVVYGHNQGRLSAPLTAMTLRQVLAAQKGWTRQFGSSACGAYQFMRQTLQGLKTELALSDGQKFDADLQDRLGYHLLKRRGFALFVRGKISATEFGRRLAMEWASFPVLAKTKGAKRTVQRGECYYAGDGLNKALVKPEEVEAVLDEVKRLAGKQVEAGTVAIVEKPVVADPGEMAQPAVKSKTVITWAMTAIGTPLAAFGNLHWAAQLVLVSAIVAFAAYGIKRRFDLAAAVRRLEKGYSE